jgi:hypothetical protein
MVGYLQKKSLDLTDSLIPFQKKGELTMSVENIRKSIEGRISFLITNPEDQFNTDSSA